MKRPGFHCQLFSLFFVIWTSITLAAETESEAETETKTETETETDRTVASVSAVLPARTASPVTRQEQVSNYSLLVSAAEKVGRELRFDEAIEVSGLRTRNLWKLGSDTDLDTVFDSVSEQLAGEELFRCAQRDCGRSTAWANLVYSDALVYGPDRNQRYLVVRQSPTQLSSIYVIRRGNRRVHLLLETLSLDTSLNDAALSAGGKDPLLELTGKGIVQLESIPGEQGEFTDEGLQALRRAGERLAGVPLSTLYVVCHIYGNEVATELLNRGNTCAGRAAVELEQGYVEAVEAAAQSQQTNRARDIAVTFVPFSAGPLLPRLRLEEPFENRVELVLPGQLRPQ